MWILLSVIGAILQHRQYRILYRTSWYAQQYEQHQYGSTETWPRTASGNRRATDLERTGDIVAYDVQANDQIPLLRREILIH